jgi:hypothetical protein
MPSVEGDQHPSTRRRSLVGVLELTDDELTAEAMAADPDAPLPSDAVPFGSLTEADDSGPALLPDWYMPAPMPGARRATAGRRRLSYVVISAVLLINAAGLCVTYGHVGMG